jgi:peptide/nickel transport system substrate-binding protein
MLVTKGGGRGESAADSPGPTAWYEGRPAGRTIAAEAGEHLAPAGNAGGVRGGRDRGPRRLLQPQRVGFLRVRRDPVILGEEMTAWASDAKKVGINMTLQPGTFNHMATVANDPGSPTTINQWAVAGWGGFYLSNYPTTLGIFSTGGSGNVGFYSNPRADKLITASVTSSNPAAVKAEASYLTQQQPSLFQPNIDFIAVWKNSVSGQPAALMAMTQYVLNAELMYLTG